MSFGFGVGDLLGAADLAYKLWKYCYKVARDAPQEFQLLVGEIITLSQAIRFLEEETRDPNSTLMRSGPDRIKMMNEMIIRVVATLGELQKIAEKYEKLGDLSRGRLKQVWSKFKWSIDASDLDALRNKLVYHNGVISLLLISCGNSSLQRLEATNRKLERRFSEIKGFIHKFGTEAETPQLSTVDAKTPKILLMHLNTALMKSAEAGERKWSAIGVDEWIQAGRWWLMKAQMELSEESRDNQNHPICIQGYLDLIKASWILIDVIARHPQLNLLDTVVRGDVELLAETIRNELEIIDTSGYLKPDMKDLLNCSLQIWESQAKGPALQPSTDLSSRTQLWMVSDEDIVFQRFAHYQSNLDAFPVPCIVLFLVRKKDSTARIVLGNQSWNTLEEFLVGNIIPSVVDGNVRIGNQKIVFASSLDARHLFVICTAVYDYQLHTGTTENCQEDIDSFALLVAMAHNHLDVLERLLESGQQCRPHSAITFSAKLRFLAEDLASKLLSERDGLGLKELRGEMGHLPVFVWAARNQYHDITAALLHAAKVVVGVEGPHWWYSLHNVVDAGNMVLLGIFLAETGFDVNTGASGNPGRTVLQSAAEGGDKGMVDILLKAGADINAAPSEYNGRTAIQAAAGGGHEAVVDILLKAGADINAAPSENNGRTAMQAAAEGGDKGMVDILLKAGADINAAPSEYNGRTAIQAAAGGGHEAVVDILLKAGADINAAPSENNGRTAMQAAAGGGHGAVVDILLKAGANINATPSMNDGRTALQSAAGGGHGAVVDILLKAGADINAAPSEYNGRTALQAAAGGGHGAVVGKLLKAGADINAAPSGYKGRTALQAAAGGGHEAVVDILLKAGADINGAPSQLSGRSALRAAAKGGHAALVKKLRQAGAKD